MTSEKKLRLKTTFSLKNQSNLLLIAHQILLVLFTFLISVQLQLPAKATNLDRDQKIENLSRSLVWLNLLYYEKTSTGYRSRVSNEHFFLNKEDGKISPSLELRTLVEKIEDPNFSQKERLDIHCQFPARILFLKKYFAINDGQTCPLIRQWKKSYRPKDLYLVYASQYISNPASAFGHSFMVISSDAVSEGLWLSHNYAAAIPPDVNPFSYVYGGMVGWFNADYSILPFYQRLFQYGSVENRNLWMYKVKLSPEELDFYIAHMWELVHQAKFTYYFMDENCAGALLRTFAALFDDMRDAKNLPIYIQPIDVVKELDRAGRIENLKLEPSQFRVLSDKLDHLNPKEYQLFK
ncbi:MAG TPA: hypothetical protein DCL41_02955, partial [Bdellovibrionales bacterium]|nr:hypothetical protein [Bdellovibrionales bacterium]